MVGNLREKLDGLFSNQTKRKNPTRFPCKFPIKFSQGKLSEKVAGSLQRAGQALIICRVHISRTILAQDAKNVSAVVLTA